MTTQLTTAKQAVEFLDILKTVDPDTLYHLDTAAEIADYLFIYGVKDTDTLDTHWWNQYLSAYWEGLYSSWDFYTEEVA